MEVNKDYTFQISHDDFFHIRGTKKYKRAIVCSDGGKRTMSDRHTKTNAICSESAFAEKLKMSLKEKWRTKYSRIEAMAKRASRIKSGNAQATRKIKKWRNGRLVAGQAGPDVFPAASCASSARMQGFLLFLLLIGG